MATDLSTPPSRGPLRRFLRRRFKDWMLRHQLPFNFRIHMIGIPLAYGSFVLLFFLPWYCCLGTFVFGFFLQWIGHQAEGNDVGEWAAIKRMCGLSYVGIAPRYLPKDPQGQ